MHYIICFFGSLKLFTSDVVLYDGRKDVEAVSALSTKRSCPLECPRLQSGFRRFLGAP